MSSWMTRTSRLVSHPTRVIVIYGLHCFARDIPAPHSSSSTSYNSVPFFSPTFLRRRMGGRFELFKNPSKEYYCTELDNWKTLGYRKTYPVYVYVYIPRKMKIFRAGPSRTVKEWQEGRSEPGLRKKLIISFLNCDWNWNSSFSSKIKINFISPCPFATRTSLSDSLSLSLSLSGTQLAFRF